MKNVQGIQFHSGSKEELLPGFAADFPYIATRALLDKNTGGIVPWHWHAAVEIFYMQSGSLEYHTPGGKMIFPAGSGGMINSNVIHMTKTISQSQKNIQLLHIFDSSLIAGEQGSRIREKYIVPVTSAPQIEIIPLFPKNPKQGEILNLIQKAFHLSSDALGYEIKLREALSEIWLALFEQASSLPAKKEKHNKNSDKIKQMMIYIHEHYPEKISISRLAAAAYLSERECFRIFHDCLRATPAEYIKSYRLQMACQMLEKSQDSITNISHACGLGSSSYFGKVFREHTGRAPSEYRKKWQDRDI